MTDEDGCGAAFGGKDGEEVLLDLAEGGRGKSERRFSNS